MTQQTTSLPKNELEQLCKMQNEPETARTGLEVNN